MAELTVDLTYGNALFQAAKEVDKVSLIAEEATGLLAVMEQETDLLLFLNTPAIAAREKKEAILKIFDGRICDELLNFLCILIDKGRSRHLAKIINAYKDLINKEEGLSYGKVLSVKPLDEGQLRKFEEETGKLLQRKVTLENELDTALVGGVKIFVDGKVIDASIKRRLINLRDSIGQ